MEQVTIAPGHWLDTGAAASYQRMRAAGMPAGLNDAGRTRAEQQKLWDDWKAGRLKVPSVAKPGTSRHETGRAIDVPAHVRDWLRTHGAKHGWINPAWAKNPKTLEPWHWEYNASNDTKGDSDMALDQSDIDRIVQGVWDRPVQRGDNAFRTVQELADAKTYGIEIRSIVKDIQGDMDPLALAIEIAKHLPAPTIDTAKLADAVANELDAREIKRRTTVKDA